MKAKRTSTAKSRATNKLPDGGEFLPWVMVLLVIFFVFMLRIRLLETPLERDEGEYAYAGQLLLQGIPPYQEAFNMKFPGVYGAYAVIMALFGETISGIHLGFILLNAGTIVLVFLLGRRLFTVGAGVAAAATYALLSLGFGVYGTQAHATHFVVAAALGATLLLLPAIDTGSRARLFLSGLLYGVAILMKQNGALFAMFGGLWLVMVCRRQNRDAWPVVLRKLGLLVFGLTVPLGLTALALWHAGVLGNFWFWTITYASKYALESSFAEGRVMFRAALPHVVGPDLALWILAAAGLVMLWWRKGDRSAASFTSAFLVFSFLAVCPGLYFREHYFVLMLPAIALLVGAAVSLTRRIAWVLFGLALGISIVQQSDYLFRLSASEVSRQMYGVNPFPQAIEVASYLRAHSGEDARTVVLGSEPEIYFYAHRRSATGYIYTYNMMEPQPFALTMQNQMIRDVEGARPEYVVFVNQQFSWLRRPDSPARIFDWWSTYGAQNYRVVGVADILSPDHTEYLWDGVENYRPSSRYIAVFRRKTP